MATLDRRLHLALVAVFAITGFSALTLQVVWQRVISLHSGVDLVSFTTVVASFLAGLGIGSLLGGWLADRLGPRRSVLAFALSNAGIAVFAWISIWLFHDVYQRIAADLDTTAATFGFNFVLLVVPATLMGLSLPLVARGVVERVEDAGAVVGRLYAVNTLGAAIGAAVTGWFLLGTFGFTTSVRFAAGLNVLAAILVLSVWRLAGRVAAAGDAHATAERSAPVPDLAPAPTRRASRAWPWYAVYALTGAVALGFELVFFRVIDSIMRSNSYSFPHVLTLYLSLFGIGAAIGARFVRRAHRPARWFLTLQSCAGLAAILGLITLVVIAPRVGLEDALRGYFERPGYTSGFEDVVTFADWMRLGFAYVGAPLLIMGVPVLLFGASFPFVEALVSERVDTLGRRTGMLIAANIVGNVAGTLLVGFVLIDQIGTSATALVLGGVLVVPGVAAALMSSDRRVRVAVAGAVVAAFAVTAVVFPSNDELWAFVHGVRGNERFELAEDRSCVSALRQAVPGDPTNVRLFVNSSIQNGYPWDDFHVLVGLTPALMHPDPGRGMALGLGMGGTAYGMAQDDRLRSVDAVEICGGEIDLLRRMAASGAPEFQRMFGEEQQRLRLRVGDGRKFLLLADRGFDLMVVDVLRPTAAFSGAIFSLDFYDLVRSRLHDGGLMASWLATGRTQNSITEAFPYVIAFEVPSYGSARFFVASASPIRWNRDEVLRRFDALGPKDFRPAQRASLRAFYETAVPFCLVDGRPASLDDDTLVNRDLAPRDEYFLNNPRQVATRAECG